MSVYWAQTFGPFIQLLTRVGALLFLAAVFSGSAYRAERRLLRTNRAVLWGAPIPVLLAGLIYGGLRFSGLLIYPTDDWSPTGPWNYTNQNQGGILLFVCGWLLIGVAAAIYRTRAHTEKSL